MVDRVVAIEDVGKETVRWGLTIVLVFTEAMKFTAYEAMGIQPLVAYIPLISWRYGSLGVRWFSALLECVAIATAALLGLRNLSHITTAVGSLLAIGLFAKSLSMLVATPGWERRLGFPALSAMPLMPERFLAQQPRLFGAAASSFRESFKSLAS